MYKFKVSLYVPRSDNEVMHNTNKAVCRKGEVSVYWKSEFSAKK